MAINIRRTEAWKYLFFLGIFSLPGLLFGQEFYVPFLVSPNPNMSGSVECPTITFQTWDGSLWMGWLKGEKVMVSPIGNGVSARPEKGLNYVTPEGKACCARFVDGKLAHFGKDDDHPFTTSDSITFKSWNGMAMYAKVLPFLGPPVVMTASVPTYVGPRFTLKDGEITDWQSNLVWKEGPDKDTSFNEAQAWIGSLGKGWRSPTREELRALFCRSDGGGVKGNMPSAFPKLGGTVVWADSNDSSTAWYVGFIYANVYSLSRDNSRFARAFAVRPK